jgi:putative acetyltransferase
MWAFLVGDGERESLADTLTHLRTPLPSAGRRRYSSGMQASHLTTDCQLRPIRPADDVAVAQIIRGVMTEHGAVGVGYSINDPEVDAMSAQYPPPGAAVGVLERDGRIVGCGGFAALPGGPAATCEVRKMYGLPAARGLGLGARLLRRCPDGARAAGYRQCYLETLASMQKARELYRKLGFTDLDGPLGNTGHCSCNSWMLKDLSGG